MRGVPDVVSMRILRNRRLPRWRASYLNKAYRNVWAIRRVVRYHDESGYFTEDPKTQHWHQVQGRWFIIFDWRH
jgi:hypothetical protein